MVQGILQVDRSIVKVIKASGSRGGWSMKPPHYTQYKHTHLCQDDSNLAKCILNTPLLSSFCCPVSQPSRLIFTE